MIQSPTYVESIGQGGLEDHTAVRDPASLGDLRLVHRRRTGVMALRLHRRGLAVGTELCAGDRVGTAVGGDSGLAHQRLQSGQVGRSPPGGDAAMMSGPAVAVRVAA